jgi:hypothetical protein
MLARVSVPATIPAAPVLGLMALGVVVALFGHAARMRGAVALGLAILFLATAAMVLAGFADFRGSSGNDPRTGCPYSGVPC